MLMQFCTPRGAAVVYYLSVSTLLSEKSRGTELCFIFLFPTGNNRTLLNMHSVMEQYTPNDLYHY